MDVTSSGFNKDRVLLAGTSTWVGKIKVRALYEDVKIEDLKLTQANANVEDSVESVCLYKAEAATTDNLIACTTLDDNDKAFFDDMNYVIEEGGMKYLYIYVNSRAMSNAADGTADSHDKIAFNIDSTAGHLTAEGVDSQEPLAYGNKNGTTEAGEIVFDENNNGTYDEAGEDETAVTKAFEVAGSRISAVDLVSSYGTTSLASAITGTGVYNVAILKVTNEANSNTTATGESLKLIIDNLVLNVTKHDNAMTLNSTNPPTIERIGGTQGAKDMTYAHGIEDAGDGAGEFTIDADALMGTDAYIEAGDTAYFVIKADIDTLDSATGVVDWIKVDLNQLDGAADTNNIDWFDGYNGT
ncbi:hypothetical protein DRN85_09800, partial [Methanosarcinales archaeon]